MHPGCVALRLTAGFARGYTPLPLARRGLNLCREGSRQQTFGCPTPLARGAQARPRPGYFVQQ